MARSGMNAYEQVVRAMVYADSPEKQARVTAELAERGWPARVLTRGVYGAIYRHPEVAQHVLSTPYRRHGMEVLAFGRNSTAVRNGDSVTKLVRASEYMSPEQRGNLLEELKRRHEITKQYLGPLCVDQSFAVVIHPLHQKPVVASEQAYTPFQPYRPGLTDVSADQALQLAEFAERSMSMDVQTGLVSDASGTDNFGFDGEGRFVLLDTIPLDGRDSHPSVAMSRRIISQLATGQNESGKPVDWDEHVTDDEYAGK